MEQREIDLLNVQLDDIYGRLSDRPSWRIVWSEDQFEQRYGTYEDRTPEGFFIREVTERRNVPKYRQWVHLKWVLERLLVVPDEDPDHPTIDSKLSYEPLWVYENDSPPDWGSVKFVVDQVYDNMAQKNNRMGPKYKDPRLDNKLAPELQEAHLQEIEADLFPNETDIGDALAYKQGVGYTTPHVK